jgi:hypothetical protein
VILIFFLTKTRNRWFFESVRFYEPPVIKKIHQMTAPHCRIRPGLRPSPRVDCGQRMHARSAWQARRPRTGSALREKDERVCEAVVLSMASSNCGSGSSSRRHPSHCSACQIPVLIRTLLSLSLSWIVTGRKRELFYFFLFGVLKGVFHMGFDFSALSPRFFLRFCPVFFADFRSYATSR